MLMMLFKPFASHKHTSHPAPPKNAPQIASFLFPLPIMALVPIRQYVLPRIFNRWVRCFSICLTGMVHAGPLQWCLHMRATVAFTDTLYASQLVACAACAHGLQALRLPHESMISHTVQTICNPNIQTLQIHLALRHLTCRSIP